ncbi:MAG: hypothetical protein MI757_04675 [Pirellulales bacterium]|nr:hypothetical protein [Pirellulales bacterium]
MRTWLPISLTVVGLMAVTWGIFAQTTTASDAAADGFYVANSVITDGAKSPKAQSLTVFAGDRVYDFSIAGSRVVIFDAESGQVMLLDKQRKLKTEIGTADLEAAREELRVWCEKRADPIARFIANPRFKVEKLEGQVAFLADAMEYHVDTQKSEQAKAAENYRDFSDAMIGLAVVSQSSPIPPLARLAVNNELAQLDVLPASVSFKVKPRAAGERSLHFRTHHAVGWQLRPEDKQLVRDARGYEEKFREVHLNEFFGRREAALGAR